MNMIAKLMHHAGYNVKDAADKCFPPAKPPASACQNVFAESTHLELVLLPGVALASDVLLQVHVVFERLSGGREGNRGQKLNHQTTKHTHGKREGEKGKEEEEREGRGKQSFRFFIPKRVKTRNV